MSAWIRGPQGRRLGALTNELCVLNVTPYLSHWADTAVLLAVLLGFMRNQYVDLPESDTSLARRVLLEADFLGVEKLIQVLPPVCMCCGGCVCVCVY